MGHNRLDQSRHPAVKSTRESNLFGQDSHQAPAAIQGLGKNSMSLINRLNPSTWAAFGLSLLLSFSAGYAYRWHQDGLKEAKHEATQVATTKTAEAAITATDEQIVQRLRTQLNTTKQRSSVLERTIEELQHANL